MPLVEPWVIWGLASAVASNTLRAVYGSFNKTELQRRACIVGAVGARAVRTRCPGRTTVGEFVAWAILRGLLGRSDVPFTRHCSTPSRREPVLDHDEWDKVIQATPLLDEKLAAVL